LTSLQLPADADTCIEVGYVALQLVIVVTNGNLSIAILSCLGVAGAQTGRRGGLHWPSYGSSFSIAWR
jgi:hypothetical protein